MHLQYVPINRAVSPQAQPRRPHMSSSLLGCESKTEREETWNRTVRKRRRFPRGFMQVNRVNHCLIQLSRSDERRSNKTEELKKKQIFLLLSFHSEWLNSCWHKNKMCTSPPSHYNNKNMLNHRTCIQKLALAFISTLPKSKDSLISTWMQRSYQH